MLSAPFSLRFERVRLSPTAAMWVCLLPLAPACFPIQGPVDVEVLAPVEGEWGAFSLQTVTLRQVTDLYAGRGTQFDVKAGVILTRQADFGSLEGNYTTFDELVRDGQPRDGPDMNPQLSFDPLLGRFVADDFDSLHYLTVLRNFEEAFDYFIDVIDDQSSASGTKGLVSFYGLVTAASWLPVPFTGAADNAAYFAFADSWVTLRVWDQEGIPLAMNVGVIVHEFSHRVFFHNVFDTPAFPYWAAAFSGNEDESDPLSLPIIRGVDEGLADIFAVGYAKHPAYMSASLEDPAISVPRFAPIAALRDLEADFAQSATYETVADGSFDDSVGCGSLDDGIAGFNPYCLGTVLATTLWEAAGRDPERLRAQFLVPVNHSLSDAGDRIADASVEAGRFTVRVEYFLDAMAARMDAAARAEFCRQAAGRFTSLLDEGLVPSCP